VYLLLDSSGPELICALADHQGVIAEDRLPNQAFKSKNIGQVAGSVLGELNARDLKAIAVGTGPGSFIGTRVAVAYANGFAVGGSAKLYGVNSLAAIAAVFGTGRSIVLRDAKRNEVYWYGPQGVEAQCRLISLDAVTNTLLVQHISSVIVETAVERSKPAQTHSEQISELIAQAGANTIRCDGVPAEGLRRLIAGEAPVPYAEPVYLRSYL